jgi:hypothetical protein
VLSTTVFRRGESQCPSLVAGVNEKGGRRSQAPSTPRAQVDEQELTIYYPNGSLGKYTLSVAFI